jgi:shikimate kinase
MTVAEIFAKYGEPEFRRLERSVISRLLHDKPGILATGGGAYMDDATRAGMKDAAFTIWLKAPIDILLGRVRKRQEHDQSRPLLNTSDMRGTLEKLSAIREPVYALADMVLESGDEPHGVLLDKIVAALASHGICEAA